MIYFFLLFFVVVDILEYVEISNNALTECLQSDFKKYLIKLEKQEADRIIIFMSLSIVFFSGLFIMGIFKTIREIETMNKVISGILKSTV